MLRASYRHLRLRFKETAITSRASMEVKDTYIIKVWDDTFPTRAGFGEVALFRGLSAEDSSLFERQLAAACGTPDRLPEISSIRFGFETALADLRARTPGVLADTAFTRGTQPITINGLIWMGTKEQMKARIRSKLDAGFHCVKLKIGGIRFEDELQLLSAMRREFSLPTWSCALMPTGHSPLPRPRNGWSGWQSYISTPSSSLSKPGNLRLWRNCVPQPHCPLPLTRSLSASAQMRKKRHC